MPRKPRKFEIGNIYHIIKRGIDGKKIFLNNQDYSRFVLGLEFFNTKNSVDIWDLIGRESTRGGTVPPQTEPPSFLRRGFIYCHLLPEGGLSLLRRDSPPPSGIYINLCYYFYMPRKPRKFEIGNVYHIIKKGIDGKKIFLNNQDYSRFVLGLEFFNNKNAVDIWDLIGRESTRGGTVPPRAERLKKQRNSINNPIVDLLAFALMPNHYHLIIREIISNGISLYMRKLGGYSLYFNEQYDRKGTLFESRYNCVEIKTDAQLFVDFNYVHTNPVELIEPLWKDQQVKDFDKAKEFLENYKWSSYRDYIDLPTFPNVINKKFFLEFFNGEENCKKAVEDWIKFKADNYKEKELFNPKDYE